MKSILRLIPTLLVILSCKEKNFPLIESSPKSISNIRSLGLYEYGKIDNESSDGKTIFFSNIKPDEFLKDRKDYPLGRLRNYLNKNTQVLKYFSENLDSKFIYYQYRNDSLISRVYLLENQLKTNEKNRITTLEKFKNVMDSLKIEYNSAPVSNKILKEYNIKKPTTDFIVLINNKYPAIIHASENLFYTEVFYNKLDNTNSIWMLEH
jgi:hypothetical protein